MYTIFQRTEISEPALFTPSDTTKKVEHFPEIRDLMSYGLTSAEKYMVLAFECGLAM